jgi:hypothetical protein
MADPAMRDKMMKERQGAVGAGRRGQPVTEKSTVVPEEYSDPSRSPLEYEVKEQSNSFDIPIP